MNIKYFIIMSTLISSVSYTMESDRNLKSPKNATIDARTFLEDHPQNKRNEHGDTYLHQLALSCSKYDEWKQMGQELEQIVNEHGKMSNPLLKNNDGATARKLAKAQFNESGNPICGTMALFLKEAELLYLDRCSSKEGRKVLAEK